MLSGNCLCGEVTFRLEGPLSDIKCCHCSQCRKTTGAAGIATFHLPKNNFKWLSGEPFIAVYSLNENWSRNFCKQCGCPLPGLNDTLAFIPAGLINEPIDNKVSHHICVDSKAEWDIIGDDGIQYSGDPGF